MDVSVAAIGRVERIPVVLADALSVDHESLSASQLLTLHRTLGEARRYLDLYAAKLTTLAARKEVHRAAGATSMDALVAREAGISRTQAHQQVRLAEQIDSSAVLRRQMVKPGMSTAKAAIITRAVDRLPEHLDATDRETVRDHLAGAAPQMSLEQLRRKANRATEVLDIKLADSIENQQLVTSEARQQRAATFWMSRPDDTGMVTGGFEIDALTADILRRTLDSLTSPRKLNRHPEPAPEPELDPNAHRRKQGAAFAGYRQDCVYEISLFCCVSSLK